MNTNFHTHKTASPADTTSYQVVSVAPNMAGLPGMVAEAGSFFSVEVHPWNLISGNGTLEALPEAFLLALTHPEAWRGGIGEVGLDRLRGADWEVQILVLRQIFSAVRECQSAHFRRTPITLHCVRCQAELLRLWREAKLPCPGIIHGFAGSPEAAQEWLRHGFYLSLGKRAMARGDLWEFWRREPEARKRLLLESDDAPEILPEIYRCASAELRMPLEDLQRDMLQKFNTLYRGF